MHLTAFSCIFLPLYTHLGQAYTIFAARESFPSSPPSSYPYPTCSSTSMQKNEKNAFFVKFFEMLTSFSSRSAIEAHRLMLGIIKALNASALPTHSRSSWGPPKITTFAAGNKKMQNYGQRNEK